ncbi:hypothetical protein [uncultured Brachybacterium sp.]|uniref:hypothetical protein n=1 Tax=uncultured Brachybacterium sp. TaxID=189680 RepID=UPI0026193714|nr:hypothetical protein [uncultured Brachybacterium sp.]
MARAIQYDPSSGRDYFSNIRFQPDDAQKLIGMAQASRLNVRDTLVYLVRAAEIDPSGRSVAVEAQVAAEAKAKEEDTSLF